MLIGFCWHTAFSPSRSKKSTILRTSSKLHPSRASMKKIRWWCDRSPSKEDSENSWSSLTCQSRDFDFPRYLGTNSSWSEGISHNSWCSNERYVPKTDFSRALPRALKKKDMVMVPSSFFLDSNACFIIVDLPEPGFPSIHRKPWCCSAKSRLSQSLYSCLSYNHSHVLVWAFLIFKSRASICSNASESKHASFCSAVNSVCLWGMEIWSRGMTIWVWSARAQLSSRVNCNWMR